MRVVKLALMWNREINDFEFCGVRMFKAEDIEDADRICVHDGRHVEWDMAEDSIEVVTKYLETAGDAGSDNLLDEIRQNILAGGTFIRFRSVDHLVQVWIAM